MRRQKILFITVPYHAGVVEVAGSWIPLNFVYLAGAVRHAGFEAEIYDAMTKNVGYEEIADRIENSMPDYVAVSAITCTTPDAVKVLELVKSINPAIKTILGGIHPTFMYDELFSCTNGIDYIIRGEGEVTLVELLNALSAGDAPDTVFGIALRRGANTITTPNRPHMHNIDGLPMAWDLLDWEDYTYYILPGSRLGAVSTSRGCEQECTFCSQQKFWNKKWRARSPEDILNEIELLHIRFGVDTVLFTDDYPSPDRTRWEKLLDLLIERKMDVKILMETRAADIIRDRTILHKYREAGIIHIYVGTEATSQRTLDTIKKNLSIEESKEALRLLRDIGIITETSMILGFSGETIENIQSTLNLSVEFNPDFAHFLAIAPWPYADIYREIKRDIKVHDYRKYNLIDPVVKPAGMTLQELDEAIIHCYKTFYMKKYEQILTEIDTFKREYMMKSMQLIMSTSFIKEKMGGLEAAPEEIKKIIAGSPA